MLISGTMLQGRYRIIRQIGGGGQALVYLAEDTNLGGLRAIKELTPDPNAPPEERQAAYDQFQREAQILAVLNHPNLVQVWGHFRVGDEAYLVMDYIDGQTLQEIMDQSLRFLPEAAVLRWAGQLCDVLDYLHRQRPPVIFRDLKPSNVMLDRSDTVKLIDFGIVRFFKPGKTMDTLRMGTMGYAPPEQYEGQGQTDARSDIYSLGATLHHLLTKRDPTQHPPFSFNTAPPRSLNPAVSPHVEAAITKALAYDRAHRFQSAQEMKRALMGAPSAPGTPTPTVTIPRPAAKRRIELRWSLLVLAALFVVLVWFLVGRGAPGARPTPTAAYTPTAAPMVAPTSKLATTPSPMATPTPKPTAPPMTEVIYSNDFQGTVGSEWSSHLTDITQNGRRFLGQFGNDTVSLTLNDLPSHRDVTVSFDLFIIRSWDGNRLPGPGPDVWDLSVAGGQTLLHTTFANADPSNIRKQAYPGTYPGGEYPSRTGAVEIDTLGFMRQGTPAGNSVYHLSFTFPHSRPPLVLNFSASGLQDLLDESWGIDNIEVRVTDPTKAPPTAMPEGERIWEKDGSVIVYIPAGEFLMGSKEDDPDASNHEHPQHTVYVSGFWIDKTEVTNVQYRKCVQAGACRAPTTCDWGKPTYSDSSKADHPVVCVTWQDAKAYCEWAGKRLPTEAEWEKAARGTDGRKYPWGNNFDASKVNFTGIGHTTPVGSYPEGASPYGVLDMAGNVWEWCYDWRDKDYYASSPQRDPQGPSSGDGRVGRGSSWAGSRKSVRVSNRTGLHPDTRDPSVGFRCVSQSP